jgi:hypothetical protein
VDPDDVLRHRLRAQGLEPRVPGGAADAVRRAFGLQAQDLNAAALSARVRTTGLVAADVEHARAIDRSIVWTWCMRGTLHLVPAEDVRWLLDLVGQRTIAGRTARQRQLGLDPDTRRRGIAAVTAALDGGPLSREDLRERVASAGVDSSGQRLIHLIGEAALAGLVCYGPGDRFVLLDDWIPPAPRPAGDAARTELVRRYRAAYGPADAHDLASWAGLPVRDMVAAWALAGAPVDPPEPPPAGAPVVRLLPAFDTYLLGYRSRALAVAPEHARAVHPGGGWIHPTLTVDGRVCGTWRLDRKEAQVTPFAPIPVAAEPALEAEVADVARFLG